MLGYQHKIVGAGFGVAASYIIVNKYGQDLGALVTATSLVGCMLPDIDHDMTKLGRKRKVVTEISHNVLNVLIYGGVILAGILLLCLALNLRQFAFDMRNVALVFVGLIVVAVCRIVVLKSDIFHWAASHRGIMHTLVVPLLLFLARNISASPIWFYGDIGLIVGYCSHLIADMMTVAGCPILFPFTRVNIRILRLKSKDSSCTVCAVVLAVLAVGLAYFICMKG